jgi:hypothetical protein
VGEILSGIPGAIFWIKRCCWLMAAVPIHVHAFLICWADSDFLYCKGDGEEPKTNRWSIRKGTISRVNVHGKEVTRKACHQVEIVLVLINMHAIIVYKSLKSYLPYRLSEVISSLLLIILFVEHLNVEVNQKRNSHHQKKEHAMIKNTQFRFEMF